MNRRLLLTAACVALVCGVGPAADIKSGPQPGKGLTPFNPLNVTGDYAGKSQCLI